MTAVVTGIHSQEEWTPPDGGTPLDVYTVGVEPPTEDGKEVKAYRPKGKPAPEIGFQGVLEKKGYGWKLTAEKKNFHGGGGGKSPTDVKSIVRQHSQAVAVECLSVMAQADLFKPADKKEFFSSLTSAIEFFVEDAGK